MSLVSQQEPSGSIDAEANAIRQERAVIDSSTRLPVMTFYASAIFWLLAASVLSLFAGIKLHSPEFLANWSFLTYGRIQPVQSNIMVYGWASMAGIGTAIWIMARLCRVQLKYPLLLTFGAVLWNIGLVVGSLGILIGDGGPFQWLEYPGYASLLLFVAYVAIGIWGVITYRIRRPGHIFVSQWYFLAALFTFPWIYATATVMLNIAPVAGVVQAIVQAWFSGNLFGLWLTALGLGIAYYMIPKVTGQPIYSYHLAAFGFWTFLLFYSWRGVEKLAGGPVPAWISTIGIVASVLTIIPIATVAVNQHMTMRNHFYMMHHSPTLRFVVMGAMAYTFSGLIGIWMSFRSVDSFLQFTFGAMARNQLELYAFLSFVLFGAMYYIVPRLVGCEWRSSWLIKIHFWGAAYGIGLMVFALMVSGLFQGSTMGDASLGYYQVVDSTMPLLRARTIADFMLLTGNIVFAFHFLIMLLRLGQPGGTPTLLAAVEPEGAHS